MAIVQFTRFKSDNRMSPIAVLDAISDVGAIGPFDQGSPLYSQISHWPPFGRLSEKVDIQSDNL